MSPRDDQRPGAVSQPAVPSPSLPDHHPGWNHGDGELRPEMPAAILPWLVLAVLQVVLCLNVLGALPLVFVVGADRAWTRRDRPAFERNLARAKLGTAVAVMLTLLLWCAFLLFFLVANADNVGG